MSNLVPTQIIDKNGRKTTVHKRAEPKVGVKKMVSAVPNTGHQENRTVTNIADLQPESSTPMLPKGSYSDGETFRIEKVSKRLGVTGSAYYIGQRYTDNVGKNILQNKFIITLTNDDNKEIQIPYSTGLAIDTVPTVEDVLHSLILDASISDNCRTPQELASEVGFDMSDYDEMHRVTKMFDSVKKQTAEFREFIGNNKDYEFLVGG